MIIENTRLIKMIATSLVTGVERKYNMMIGMHGISEARIVLMPLAILSNFRFSYSQIPSPSALEEGSLASQQSSLIHRCQTLP